MSEIATFYVPGCKLNNWSNIETNLFLLFQQCMQQKFKYKNLPPEIPHWAIEKALFWNGTGVFFKLADKYFVLRCANMEGLDLYGKPYKVKPIPYNGVPSFPVVQVGHEYNPSTKDFVPMEAVYMENNAMRVPTVVLLEPWIKRLGYLWSLIGYNECVSRLTAIMYGDKDAERQMRKEMKKLIGDSAPFPIIQNDSFQETLGKIDFDIPYRATEYWEDFDKTFNYLMAFFGVNSKLETKRERLVAGEVGVNEEFIELNNSAMEQYRQDFVKQINELFGLDIELVVYTREGDTVLSTPIEDVDLTEEESEEAKQKIANNDGKPSHDNPPKKEKS